jgi:aminodeoxyfutalosine deaminase
MRFLKANRLFDGFSFREQSSVLVIDELGGVDTILDESAIDPSKIEYFDGILSPGFINAHCHLELSHLKGCIVDKIGLVDFALKIITTRNQISEANQLEAMRQADLEMWNNGIVGVGDICNTDLSTSVKLNSSIQYHSFVELIGLNPNRSQMVFSQGLDLLELFKNEELHASLAPHAPYSVSRPLMQLIRLFNLEQNTISSIHHQESAEENLFFKGEKNDFQRLYATLGIDISWFTTEYDTSFEYISEQLTKPYKQLLVHNTFTDEATIKLAATTNAMFCFCPLANLYIENRVPKFSLFNADSFVLGTDSLASNHQLDVLAEVNCLLENSDYTPEQALKAITSTGASYLQMPLLGSFEKDKQPGVNLLQEKKGKFSFQKKII